MSVSRMDGPSWLLNLLRLFRQDQGLHLINVRFGVLFCARLTSQP